MYQLSNKNYEAERLSELRKYNILDTLTEKDYEDVTFLASVICNVPIALISFVDKDRQWFKSHKGLEATETSREYSFCAHAIRRPDEVMIIQNSHNDDRFKNNPLVTGEPKIVFYAGVPLFNKEGFGLGTVCVIDREERILNPDQVKALEAISAQVMNLLELRKAKEDLEVMKYQLEGQNQQLEQFAMVVAHDIKSPLSTVLSANNLLKVFYEEENNEDAAQLVGASHASAKQIKSLVDGILAYYKGGSGFEDDEEIDLAPFFDKFKKTILLPKPWVLTYNLENKTIIFNRTQLQQIFFNLISNGIRYNKSQTAEISIETKETEDAYLFTISDNGIGIKPENADAVFNLFSTITSRDSFGVKGTGIGLPTVKKIIENAGGTITLQSKPGMGTTFSFSLQKKTS